MNMIMASIEEVFVCQTAFFVKIPGQPSFLWGPMISLAFTRCEHCWDPFNYFLSISWKLKFDVWCQRKDKHKQIPGSGAGQQPLVKGRQLKGSDPSLYTSFRQHEKLIEENRLIISASKWNIYMDVLIFFSWLFCRFEIFKIIMLGKKKKFS